VTVFRTKEVRVLSKSESRAARMSERDAREWAERQLHDIGRALSDFDRYRNTNDLKYALQSSKELTILLQEIANRLD
jgi:hypothetical protein